ncbi:MAG: molybdopterin-dependent oxidoreductase, partial [Intestinibacter sp.]
FGFEEYKAYLESLDLDFLDSECNIGKDVVEKIARIYCEKYSTILIGHGLQRYKNGGNTIRAINALAAMTGQIGFSGGGVNYANSIYPRVLNTDPYYSYRYADNREFYVSNISDFIEDPEKYSVGVDDNTPVKAIVVTKSNLLNQLPDLNRLKEAFSKIEFKVCFDLFMTDTAQMCDLFIPTSTTLESEDLVFSSMCNPYLTYNECAVEPKHKLMDEYYFFMELARKMNIENYPFVTKEEYLSRVIRPLRRYYKDIDLEFIKHNYINIQQDVAWSDKIFETVTKRYEFFSLEALYDGVSPIPVYDIGYKYDNLDDKKMKKLDSKKFRLLTMHHKNTISSAHFMDEEGICRIYINDRDAEEIGVEENDVVRVKSHNGEINARVSIDEDMLSGVVNIYQGWWKKHGNPNYLIDSEISDFGGQVAYYDTFVEIEKIL